MPGRRRPRACRGGACGRGIVDQVDSVKKASDTLPHFFHTSYFIMNAPLPPGHQFVSERFEPCADTFDTARMATGEPGLPRRFRWRGETYEVARILDAWKTDGPCISGSGERYVRRHWYHIATTDGGEMRLYFDRSPKPGAAKQRWWIATRRPPDDSPPPACS